MRVACLSLVFMLLALVFSASSAHATTPSDLGEDDRAHAADGAYPETRATLLVHADLESAGPISAGEDVVVVFQIINVGSVVSVDGALHLANLTQFGLKRDNLVVPVESLEPQDKTTKRAVYKSTGPTKVSKIRAASTLVYRSQSAKNLLKQRVLPQDNIVVLSTRDARRASLPMALEHIAFVVVFIGGGIFFPGYMYRASLKSSTDEFSALASSKKKKDR